MDVDREIGIDGTAIMQKTQLEEFLLPDMLRSSEQGSHCFEAPTAGDDEIFNTKKENHNQLRLLYRLPRNNSARTWKARSDARGRHAAALAHVGDDFADGLTDGPVGVGLNGSLCDIFWQLKDVAREFGMDDTAIIQRMQPAEFLWLKTLRSREK